MLVSTQLDPHWVVPPPQLVAQALCEQTLPLGQTVPHVPQLALSVWVVVQEPPQSVLPAPHADAQVPALQTFVAPQAFPQPPQLLGSLLVSIEPPSQTARPPLHPLAPSAPSPIEATATSPVASVAAASVLPGSSPLAAPPHPMALAATPAKTMVQTPTANCHRRLLFCHGLPIARSLLAIAAETDVVRRVLCVRDGGTYGHAAVRVMAR